MTDKGIIFRKYHILRLKISTKFFSSTPSHETHNIPAKYYKDQTHDAEFPVSFRRIFKSTGAELKALQTERVGLRINDSWDGWGLKIILRFSIGMDFFSSAFVSSSAAQVFLRENFSLSTHFS